MVAYGKANARKGTATP